MKFRLYCPACEHELWRMKFLLYPFRYFFKCPYCGCQLRIHQLCGVIGTGLIFIPCIAGVMNFVMGSINLVMLIMVCVISVIVANILFPFITRYQVVNGETLSKTKQVFFLANFIIIVSGLISGLVFYKISRHGLLSDPDNKPDFKGSSQLLKMTEIVPTLDSPLQKKRNIVWCASFLTAWKQLEADIAKKPIILENSPEISQRLQNAANPQSSIPAESLYVAAGWNNKGIVDKIRREVVNKFPGKTPPLFPGILPDSIVAYCYMQVSVKFKMPYFQSRKPMMFKDSSGTETAVSSFGIREEDDYAYFKLRKQPKVLYERKNEKYEITEFAVDLDQQSAPCQIVLAVVEPLATLGKTIKYTMEKIKSNKNNKDYYYIVGINDVLLIPDIAYDIKHRFKKLENKNIINSKLKNQTLNVLQQDIRFTLNRSGAELVSQSKMYCLPTPSCYYFNRPFLIYIKKRDAEIPFFAMWVANAELLKKWK